MVKRPVVIDPRRHAAVIFDLDGVVTDTASIHAAAWKTVLDVLLARLAGSRGEGHTEFTAEDYRRYVDGKYRSDGIVDFLYSRNIELPLGDSADRTNETVCGLGNLKQEIFLERVGSGVPVFDSTVAVVRELAAVGVKTAVCSSSRNCGVILRSAGLGDLFDVQVDGVLADELGLSGKPSPDALLEAARRLGTDPKWTVVVEDAEVGVSAGRSGGFALVIGVDRMGHADDLLLYGADVVIADLGQVEVRAGDRRRSLLPNALESAGQLMPVWTGRKPLVYINFDYLSELIAEPDSALDGGAVGALRRLVAQCHTAILSGRDPADIRDRVGLPGIWYVRSRGFEMVGPDGSHHHNEAVADVMMDAAAELREVVQNIPGAHVECTPFSAAVHYRDAAPAREADVITAVRRQARARGLGMTFGHKVVELQPEPPWDVGPALSWIYDRIARTGQLVPIFVGGESADEDAFDAIALTGVAIVVRREGDDDRPTAAHFTLDNPGEIVEFIARIADSLGDEQTSKDAWTFTFDDYEPHTERQREALCTVGNGYFATRGAAPESKAGEVHYPGTYAAGVFNRLDDVVEGMQVNNESLVNVPNWLPLRFRIDDGDWFDVDAVTLLSYRQTFDLRSAVLTREMRFRDDGGRTTSLVQQRLVSMHNPHLAALQTTFLAEDWSGALQIRSTLDANVRNSLVDRYRGLACDHLTSVKTAALGENSVLLAVETTQSHIRIALAARTTVWNRATPASATYRLFDEELEIGNDIITELAAGESLRVEKIVTVATGRDVAISESAEGAERQLGRHDRFDDLLHQHKLAWAQLWERLSIDVDGHTDEMRFLRLHLLHLLQTVSHHSEELDVGVPARGLHGEAYRGHVFWDELFVFSVLNVRLPQVTRSLLRYRSRRLPEARRAAEVAGYRGAMFPWQSGSDGREESQQLHLNPRSGRWIRDPSHLAHHIGVAVAYNVWQFFQATGELAYMIDHGVEMLVEIARFWSSRTTYDADADRFHIRGVIGPDEFHSGYPDHPNDGVDDNAYTNVMAVWVILRAIDALESVPLPNRLDLLEKLRLTTPELAQWHHVSRRMFVPFHDGVISQFDGYERLAELNWDSYRHRYGNVQRLDRILEAEDDDVNRYKAAKQADALMLLYLLSSDELCALLSRLDYVFDPQQIPTMVEYYLARTSHGSTLSDVVHTWVLARANRDRALEFFERVLISDVSDIQGGTTAEGIHLGAMAGSVDLVQRCFTGLEMRDDRLILSPNWPQPYGPLSFSIHYRGHHMRVRVSGKGAEIIVDPRDAPPVLIECRGRIERVAAGRTVKFSDDGSAQRAVAPHQRDPAHR